MYNGAWGVDPFLPSGTILGSSSDGLYVFRPVGLFGGSVGVPTRWTIDITVVEDLFVDSLVTVQGDPTVELKADMDILHDIAIADNSTLTLNSSDGMATITASQGLVTIGIPGSGGSAKITDGDPGSAISGNRMEEMEASPGRIRLWANYPNPFNPVTVIRYELPEESPVILEVYDVLGRRVAVLVDEIKPAGVHEVNWDATSAASGLYIYRLQAGEFVQSRQMTFIK